MTSAEAGRLRRGPVRVRVPATSANLGPGFDALGVALSLHDVVTVEVGGDRPVTVRVEGEGAADVPDDETHLIHRAMVRAFEALRVDPPPVRLHCANQVPHGRGLGSSSAAIVAGMTAARALVTDGDARLDDDALFALAADMEGHPDNVAPAVHGGLTIAYGESGGGFHAVRLDVVPEVAFVALVPSTPLATEVARGLLPAQVPHRDASCNAGRAALLVAALTSTDRRLAARRTEVLLAATEDRLHQAYRAPAMPHSARLLAGLRAAGHPATVSGAGPTVLAVVERPQVPAVLGHAPEGWRALPLEVDTTGVRVEHAPGHSPWC